MTLQKAVGMVVRTPDYLLELLGKMPTTNARIVVTLVVMLLTAGRYIASQTWEPSVQWLAFIVAMAGVDAAQFLAKRSTDADYVAAKQSPATPGEPNAAG